MAELVDALISGVSGETRADSNSVIRTIKKSSEEGFFSCLKKHPENSISQNASTIGQRKNMGHINVQYKKEFTEKFKAACKKLGISQSEVIRSAMEETIRKAEEIQ